jgi:YVTN family beta-propeller protein
VNRTRQRVSTLMSGVAVLGMITVMVGGSAHSATTPTVTATVSVGSGPRSVAITPDGTRVYTTNQISDTVSVIDTATNTLSATVPVGDSPNGVAITPDGTSAYVTNYVAGTVSVIDTATNSVTATVTVSSYPQAVAITPDGRKAYVAYRNTGTVSVIDTATNSVTATVTLFTTSLIGSNSTAIAFTPDGTKAYVTNTGISTVSVIKTSDRTVTTVTGVGQPQGVAITPDGTTAYIPDRSGPGTVSVMNTSDNTVRATVAVGNTPTGVAISPNGTKAYVSNFQSNSVSVIDTATNTVSATVTVGSQPEGVAISPNGTTAYVVNLGSNTVSVIDTGMSAIPGQTTLSTIATAEFRFYLPDGSECTSISPQILAVGSNFSLPKADALCGMDNSIVSGWRIPGQANAFEVGRSVRVTSSQQFTAVLEMPWVIVIFDANVGAGDLCMQGDLDVPGDARDEVWSIPRAQVTDQPLPSAAICTPEGYVLSGWVDRRSDPWTVFSTDDQIPGTAVDVDGNAANEINLYAKWARS